MRTEAFLALPLTFANKGIGTRVQSEPVPLNPLTFNRWVRIRAGGF
ncbi:MAG: hypothetical protein AB4368_24175 [Xenococcaceae cyanobacterium]